MKINHKMPIDFANCLTYGCAFKKQVTKGDLKLCEVLYTYQYATTINYTESAKVDRNDSESFS